jgi:hypothetical protein
MIALIAYFIAATLTLAVAQVVCARKGRLWECLGLILFCASMAPCVAFGIKGIQWIHLLDFFTSSTNHNRDILGAALFTFVSSIAAFETAVFITGLRTEFALSLRGH